MSKRIAIAGLLIAVAVPSVHGDSYRPFRNFRQVDPTGRYYVVVKKNGGPEDPGDAGDGTPVTLAIAERKPGTGPVSPAEDSEGRDEAIRANPDVKVREGDRLLGRGKLDRSPRYIVISSTGLGVVGLDVRGHNYGNVRSPDALVIVRTDASVRHRKALIDLFSAKEIEQFVHSAGSIFWVGGGWIDEARKDVIVVGSREWPDMEPIPRLFRVVNLETGIVRRGSPELILTALSARNLGALPAAIELAGELKLNGAKDDLVKVFSDDKLSLAVHLRACVALAALGDRRGGDLMKKTAFADSPERGYAIGELPSVIGDDAAALLCDLVRRSGDVVWRPGQNVSYLAWVAMRRVSGEAAVPPLLLMLKEAHCPTCIDFAVECLGEYGPKAGPAVPDLIKLLERQPKTRRPLWTQQLAAIALGRIGPGSRAALPALIRLAEIYAGVEWERLKSRQSEPPSNAPAEMKYSDDVFVDAICKIR
jgi:hypothetical protein